MYFLPNSFVLNVCQIFHYLFLILSYQQTLKEGQFYYRYSGDFPKILEMSFDCTSQKTDIALVDDRMNSSLQRDNLLLDLTLKFDTVHCA